jgi:hypothetical protein
MLGDSQGADDLSELLACEDPDPVMHKILPKIITLFYTVSKSELRTCAEKAAEKVERLETNVLNI